MIRGSVLSEQIALGTHSEQASQEGTRGKSLSLAVFSDRAIPATTQRARYANGCNQRLTNMTGSRPRVARA